MSNENYWHRHKLGDLIAAFDSARGAKPGTPGGPIAPVIDDLVELHRTVLERRRFTVLEFGVGYSTIVLAAALAEHERQFKANAPSGLMPPADAFQVYSIDANEGWLASVRSGLGGELAARIHLHHSTVSVAEVNHRLCHLYDGLPDIVPDLIYLDGPDPRDVQGSIRGLGFKGGKRVPMSADVLLMEPTLLPGTIILVDGRVANARFLQDHLKRHFRVTRHEHTDVTRFELAEAPLGERDARRIAYQANREQSTPGFLG